jgi:hypothetical protein
MVGRSSWYRGRANPRKWEETGTGAETNERSAARRSSPLPQGRGRDGFKKRKTVEAVVPARIARARVWLPARRNVHLQKSVGDVWPRISSANALQKERQGRVNGGLARSFGRRVKPSAGASSEGSSRESGSSLQVERAPAQDPGWRESSIQRSRHRQKRWRGLGTRVVTTTGSYEGYLPIEGIPDHHEASAFTRRRQR